MYAQRMRVSLVKTNVCLQEAKFPYFTKRKLDSSWFILKYNIYIYIYYMCDAYNLHLGVCDIEKK